MSEKTIKEMAMEKEKMTKCKWFWAWDDDKEEKWLESMSQDGWHLVDPGFPCVYRFCRGDARPYSYRLDFRSGSFKSLQEYLQICQDAGWELVGRMGGWYYFRKEGRDGEKPEFFSDRDSKVRKYGRLLMFLVIFLPILINGMLTISKRQPSPFMNALGIFFALIIIGYAYAIVRLLRRISTLKKN
jgi:hypothetical protein